MMAKMGFNEPGLVTEYVGVQKGWAVVGGQTCYFKSKLEHRWAQYLELLKGLGEIVSWSYEPRKFEFKAIRSGTVFYTPDFLVLYGAPYKPDCCWHEVKGHLTNKDITKFRRMAKYYPDEKIILVMQTVPKKYNEKKRKIGNAQKYVERIMEAEKILRKVGL